MNNYNAQTTAHVGYIIALSVGIAAILYQIKIGKFIKNNFLIRLAFYVPLSALFGAIVFSVLRLLFWAWMSSAVLGVTLDQTSGAVTTIYGIHDHLVKSFMGYPGIASLFYSIDNAHFGFSPIFLSAITLLGVLLMDCCYAYRKERIIRQYFVGLTLFYFLTIALFVIDPVYLNPTIANLFR